MFLLGNMAPATHAHEITNEYFLNANIKYDGCTCGVGPSISIPMSVIPVTTPSYNFDEPQGYQPVVLGSFRCDIPMH